jgi:UDP-glucuronate 4-epimerase
MHVLVTGAAGFVGSHVVDSLLRDAHHVTAVDNFDPFYDRALKERNIAEQRENPRWRLAEVDLRDAAALAAVLTGSYDAIVHLAAKAGVRPSIADPVGHQEVNVQGTHNLLELARRKGIRQFIFASSSSVYGVNPRLPWSEDDAVLRPISPYASTKVSAELLGHVYSHLYGIRFLALRLFTAYGPRQRPDLAIHKFAELMTSHQPVPLFGKGGTRRDYTYVDDIVSGIRAALEYRGSDYEVINLGNSHTIALLDMLRELENALGCKAEIEWLPEQPGDVPQTWANIAKAGALLGYTPRTPFEVGVRRFADWFMGSSRRNAANT